MNGSSAPECLCLPFLCIQLSPRLPLGLESAAPVRSDSPGSRVPRLSARTRLAREGRACPLGLALAPSTMMCPGCFVSISRAGWTKGQWRYTDPHFNGLRACCRCEDALNNAVPDAAVIAAIRENILNEARAAPPRMAGFVQRWMDDLGAKERKKLSYLGVVRAWPGSPVHCSDAWGDGCWEAIAACSFGSSDQGHPAIRL